MIRNLMITHDPKLNKAVKACCAGAGGRKEERNELEI